MQSAQEKRLPGPSAVTSAVDPEDVEACVKMWLYCLRVDLMNSLFSLDSARRPDVG